MDADFGGRGEPVARSLVLRSILCRLAPRANSGEIRCDYDPIRLQQP
jgi:hypothetical protein